MYGKKWNDEDEKRIKELIANGKKYQEIATEMGRTYKSCVHRIYSLGLKESYEIRRHAVDDYFWSVPNKINSYWGGFSIADCSLEKGTNRFALSLSIKDSNHLDLFRTYVRSDGIYSEHKHIVTRKGQKNPFLSHVICLRITSKQWKEDLAKNFNIVTKKTQICSIPEISNILLPCWLVGYIDGDGHISLNKDNSFRIGFVTSSKNLISGIRDYISNNFYENTLSHRNFDYRRENENIYRLQVNGLRAAVLFDYLHQIQGLPRLSRKWEQPQVLEHVANLKQKHPHLFKVFPYNDELNKQIIDNKLFTHMNNSLEKSLPSPIT